MQTTPGVQASTPAALVFFGVEQKSYVGESEKKKGKNL